MAAGGGRARAEPANRAAAGKARAASLAAGNHAAVKRAVARLAVANHAVPRVADEAAAGPINPVDEAHPLETAKKPPLAAAQDQAQDQVAAALDRHDK